MSQSKRLTEDISQTENRAERAVLVGLCTDSVSGNDFDLSMNELVQLTKACDMEVLFYLTQSMPMPNKATYIGSGKVDEVRAQVEESDADIVVFNDSLSPMQLRNLQRELKVPILDRTLLILEIFSKRAKTREARIQVEVAQLQYMLPRLVGLHGNLNRQGGTSGSMSNRGVGEKKLELDKRRLEHRLNELKKELTEVETQRRNQKKKRSEASIPRVALVGYTNAGKSTLMNAMIEKFYKEPGWKTEDKMVYEENMLFATLDTTVRKITPTNSFPFLLSDTVGFVSNLPHGLVKAFCSTLEEVTEADLLLHVVDAADMNHDDQTGVTRKVLEQLNAAAIPVIYVYNKADLTFENLPIVRGNRIYLSAKNRVGVEELISLIEKQLSNRFVTCSMLFPYNRGDLVTYFQENAVVMSTEYLPEGVKMEVYTARIDYEKYKAYQS